MVRHLAWNRVDAEAFVRAYSGPVRAPTVIDRALPAATNCGGGGTITRTSLHDLRSDARALEQYTRFPNVYAKLRAQTERARQALERWEAQKAVLERTRNALLLLAMLRRREEDPEGAPLPARERATALRRALAHRVRKTL